MMWMWSMTLAQAAPLLVCAPYWKTSDYCVDTLDEALASGAPEIVLSPGTHTTFSTLIRGRSVHIRALQPDLATVVTSSLYSLSDTVIIVDGGDVIFEGFDIVPDYFYGPKILDHRAVAVTGGATVYLQGMRIFHGYHSAGGGGLWVDDGSQVTVERSIFGDNSTFAEGGAIRAVESSLTVRGTLFDVGSATNGGAISAISSSLVVQGSVFVGNGAELGGAIGALQSPAIDISSSWFCGQGAQLGGAIYAMESCAVGCRLDNNVFQDSWAYDVGGALFFDLTAGPTDVHQNTFWRNQAYRKGSAADFYRGSEVLFRNNLIVENGPAGGAVVFDPRSQSTHLSNAWFGNLDFALGGRKGAEVRLPDADVSLARAPVWIDAPFVPVGCGEGAILDPRVNELLIERGIGAFSSDLDGDGLPGAFDCDDTNADVYPGAEEIPGNGLDDDCDGVELCYVDRDGDGIGSDVAEAPGGNCNVAPFSSIGGDCRDNDPTIAACSWVVGGGGCSSAPGSTGAGALAALLLLLSARSGRTSRSSCSAPRW